MSDEAQAVAQEDPYDLSESPVESSPSLPAAAPAASTGAAVSQPRNPDGTFAKAPEPKHPAYLIEQAKDFGFTDQEIDETPSNILGRALYRLQTERRTLAEQFSRQQDLSNAAVSQTALPPAPPAEPDLGIPKELEEGLDPALVAWMKKQARENAELKQQLQQTHQILRQREDETRGEAVDRIIAADGRFGEGSINALPQDSAERYKRMAILTTAQQLAGTRANFNQVLAKLPEAIKRLYGDKQAAPSSTPETPKPKFTLEEWNAGATARPTQRAGAPEPKGDAKAIANLRAKMQERGLLTDDEADMRNGLPD